MIYRGTRSQSVCGELWNWFCHCIFISCKRIWSKWLNNEGREKIKWRKNHTQFSLYISAFDFKEIYIVFVCRQTICLAASKIFMTITIREKKVKWSKKKWKKKTCFIKHIHSHRLNNRWDKTFTMKCIYVKRRRKKNVWKNCHWERGGSLVVLLLLKRIYQWTLSVYYC